MATRTITFQHSVEGTLTDVTSAALSDPTGTFGVKRDDTDAVVVADGTAMTHQSTGVYTYAFTDPGVAMTAYVEYVYLGATYRFEDDLPSVAAGEWYYADQQDVIDLVGQADLQQISNEPGTSTDTVIDSARVTRTGELVDALMDGELSRLGYTVPLVNTSDDETIEARFNASMLILANVNAGMVVRELNRPRAMLQPSPTKSLSEMDRRIVRCIADAEHIWRKIKLGAIRITADRAASTPASGAVYVPTWSDSTWSGITVLP